MIPESRHSEVDSCCRICGKKFYNLRSLCCHLNKGHHITCKEYYDSFFRQKGEGFCIECGKETKQTKLRYKYNLYCSRECANKNSTRLQNVKNSVRTKYGVDYCLQRKDIREQIKKTNIEKYGGETPMSSEKVREKSRRTMENRYGKWYTKTEEYLEKIKITSLNKYGTISPNKNKEVRKRQEQSFQRKYGFRNPMQVESIKEKARATSRERYGVDYYMQTEEGQRRKVETCYKKYGVRNHMQNKSILSKCMSSREKVVKEGVSYDSEWEYLFAKYLMDKKIKYEYHPHESFEYSFKGASFRYFPDFKIFDGDGKPYMIEIKGDYLAKMMCKEDSKAHEKWKCMISHGVKILYDRDLVLLGIKQPCRFDKKNEEALDKLKKEEMQMIRNSEVKQTFDAACEVLKCQQIDLMNSSDSSICAA